MGSQGLNVFFFLCLGDVRCMRIVMLRSRAGMMIGENDSVQS